MTYKTTRAIVRAGTTGAAALAFLIVPLAAASGLGFATAAAAGAVSFVLFFALKNAAAAVLERWAYKLSFRGRETRLITEFADRVGLCFTVLDLVDAIRDMLEKAADMGVVLLKSGSWELVYQSPSAAAGDPRLAEILGPKFRDRAEGVCHFGEDLSPVRESAGARGFLIVAKGFHLFVFTRLCAFIEPEAFRTLYGELRTHFDRVPTISGLFEVASLSREWQLIAETQRSFLPHQLPSIGKIDISVLYRPLVNVSGDYYDVIPVDEHRTLIVVGDVSGKGLAAALIMGIIVNTIRIAREKSDLAALIRSVDASIRDMGFDDKFAVMFIGLVDTSRRTLRYVNAAMADPMIITQTATGPSVLRLQPTMGLVGLVPFEDVPVEELPLLTDQILLLASDGVTEVSDASGARLGETELFEKTLALASTSDAADFVSSVSAMLYSFVGERPLIDDITMLAVRLISLTV